MPQPDTRRLLTRAYAWSTYLPRSEVDAVVAAEVADASAAAGLTSRPTVTTLSGSVRYFRDAQGIVHLSGTTASVASGATIGTLPVGYRPSTTVEGPATSYNLTQPQTARVSIATTGVVTINAMSSTTSTWSVALTFVSAP